MHASHDHVYYLSITAVASVPIPSFPSRENDPVLLSWHWVLIALSIAFVLIVATVIGMILVLYACRKSPPEKVDKNLYPMDSKDENNYYKLKK